MTYGESLINKHLRKHPLPVRASKLGLETSVFQKRKRTGMLTGISGGFVRVRLDGNQKDSWFFERYFEAR